MNFWSNIEIPLEDREICAINELEQSLGPLPKEIIKVRELITRFELCHFKVRTHYEYVRQSITALKPVIDLDKIGAHHPRHGKGGIKNDPTGRSEPGQLYIEALKAWLEDHSLEIESSNREMNRKVAQWLGDRGDEKIRLVTMLIDRLLYKNLKEYLATVKLEGLDFQVLATDICNYNFPDNIEKVIQAIGRLEPLKEFHGCGTFNPEIKSFLYEKFKELCLWLACSSTAVNAMFGKREPVKEWLVASFAKTLKEQIHVNDSVPILPMP